MDTHARTFNRIVRSSAEFEDLKTIAIFCGLGLLLSLLAVISCGLDGRLDVVVQ
jgi:hypothetical protein